MTEIPDAPTLVTITLSTQELADATLALAICAARFIHAVPDDPTHPASEHGERLLRIANDIQNAVHSPDDRKDYTSKLLFLGTAMSATLG